ncbi:hypothetical protein GW793_01110 [bacterium]|uniref:Uncharacterized protein n=2 Tax=Katanobacteria TaxID=422282 RepID=A0A2M7X3R9_UNCKA|nr:hypothetical protein [bacterium]PIP56050.1 MAG: hypothetical protein COX05_04980 [candidate division WWE3 bacterium CG22_combo_CG10-13_8_21_14_all_39_12]PJA40813.1 MAG: hypothetical protein CO179_01305 [candidate division WWE3 bacterium CG_4_9_14_3_um_filter_39_7]
MIKSTCAAALYSAVIVYYCGGIHIIESTFASAVMLSALLPILGLPLGSNSRSKNLSGCFPGMVTCLISLAMQAAVLRIYVVEMITNGTSMNASVIMIGVLGILIVIYGCFYLLGIYENQQSEEG